MWTSIKSALLGFILAVACALPALANSLELNYQMKIDAGEKSDECENKLILGTDKLINVKRGRETLIDCRNKQVELMGREIGDDSYIQYSLHALVGMQECMLKSFTDNFTASAFSGLSRSDAKASDNSDIKISEKENKIEFTYKDKPYVSVEFGDPLPAQYERMLEKAIIFSYRLHPYVRKQILARKKIFTRLIINDYSGKTDLKTTMQLESKNEISDSPSIPENFKRVYNKKSPLYMLQELVTDAHALPPLPTKESTFAESKKMLSEGNQVDAFLNMMEYGLTTGDQAIPENKIILADAKKNPTILTIAASIVPDSEKSANQALQAFGAIDQSKLEKGYLLEIFKGNIKAQLGQNGTLNFLKALSRNPYITGAQKDLGDNFRQGGDCMNAWSCYEMARKICPKHPCIVDIDDLEKNLEKNHPECYSF